MSVSDAVHAVEDVLKKLWDDIEPHVVDEAKGDVQQLVTDAKSQVSQLAVAAAQAAQTDVADAAATIRDAAQALTVPINDLPADQRPPLASEAPAPNSPSQAEQEAAVGSTPLVDVPQQQDAPMAPAGQGPTA